jgi:hypothetical protein
MNHFLGALFYPPALGQVNTDLPAPAQVNVDLPAPAQVRIDFRALGLGQY